MENIHNKELINRLMNGEKIAVPFRYLNTKRVVYLTTEEQLLGEVSLAGTGVGWKTFYDHGKRTADGIKFFFTMDVPYNIFNANFHTDKLDKEILKAIKKVLNVKVYTHFRYDYRFGEKHYLRKLKNEVVLGYDFVPPTPIKEGPNHKMARSPGKTTMLPLMLATLALAAPAMYSEPPTKPRR